MRDDPSETAISYEAAAKILGVARSTVAVWVHRRVLPRYKGDLWVGAVRESDVLALERERRTNPGLPISGLDCVKIARDTPPDALAPNADSV